MIVWPLRGAVAAAVVLAVLVARRAPQHRPIALALGAALVLDCARALLPLPGAVELGLYAGAAALSVWVAVTVSGSQMRRQNRKLAQIGKLAAFVTGAADCHGTRILSRPPGNFSRSWQLLALAAWTGVAVIADLADPRLARVWIPPLVLAVAVVAQSALAARWRLRGGPSTVSQHCALVLLAGDVAALLGPAGVLPWPRSWWWVAAAQAALVAVVLVGIQGRWLASSKIDTGHRRSS